MRVLFLMSTGEADGAETATITALHHLPGDIEARAALLSPGPIVREFDELGIPVTTIPPFGKGPWDRLGLSRAIDRIVRDTAPSVVYATGNKAAVFGLAPSRRRRIPLVWQKPDTRYDGRGARM